MGGECDGGGGCEGVCVGEDMEKALGRLDGKSQEEVELLR
jgi:hypothetical protein